MINVTLGGQSTYYLVATLSDKLPGLVKSKDNAPSGNIFNSCPLV